MSQSQASDQWAFYQAKSMKENLYTIEREKLEMEMAGLHGAPKALVEAHQQKITEYGKKIEKYEAEKADIQEEAKRLETLRDEVQAHASVFGLAVIFLQIAILLSSVSGLLEKKPIWYCGLAVGAVGVVYFLNGFLLVM